MSRDQWDYSQKGMAAYIRPGAYSALRARGWDGCDKPDRDGEHGTVIARAGIGTDWESIGVRFEDGEEIGFPPQFVQVGAA